MSILSKIFKKIKVDYDEEGFPVIKARTEEAADAEEVVTEEAVKAEETAAEESA